MGETSERSEPVKTDTVKIYGFSFDFPITDRLEFNPKFRREAGDLAVKSPTRSVVFVSWGELDKAVKKLPTPADHANFSIEKIAKETRGKLSSREQKEIPVSGHMAAYNHVKVETPGGAFGGGRREQEIESLHIHCENTSRYFVVYATYGPDNSDDARRRTIRTIIESFKCH